MNRCLTGRVHTGYLVLGGLSGGKIPRAASALPTRLKASVSAALLRETKGYAAACCERIVCCWCVCQPLHRAPFIMPPSDSCLTRVPALLCCMCLLYAGLHCLQTFILELCQLDPAVLSCHVRHDDRLKSCGTGPACAGQQLRVPLCGGALLVDVMVACAAHSLQQPG